MDPNNYFLRRDFTLQVIPQILRQNVLEFCWMTSRLKILRTKLPRLKSPRSKQWPERHDCIRNLRRLKWVSHFPSQNYRNSWCSSRSKQTQGKNAPAPSHAPSVRRGPLSPHRPHARCPRQRCRRWWVRWSSSFAASMRPRDPRGAEYGRMVKQWTKEMIWPSLDILELTRDDFLVKK